MSNDDNASIRIRTIYLALSLITAVLSGTGGTYVWLRTSGSEIVAPDRFTGTQASALIESIEEIEDKLIQLDQTLVTHQLNHPDRNLDLRLSIVEANYKHIISTLERIEAKVDGNGK